MCIYRNIERAWQTERGSQMGKNRFLYNTINEWIIASCSIMDDFNKSKKTKRLDVSKNKQ